MKATELIAALQKTVDQYGDMDLLVRYPEGGSGRCWNEITIFPDPPSPMERELGIQGSIDIDVAEGKHGFCFRGNSIIDETPLGVIVAERSSDPEHPGVFVFFRRTGSREEINLALVEFSKEERGEDVPDCGGIFTHVWKDADSEDEDSFRVYFHQNLTTPLNHE